MQTLNYDSLQEVTGYLNKIEIFKDLSVQELENLSGQVHMYHFSEGQILYNPAASSESLFILLEGSVKLYRLSPEGKTIITGIVKVGDIFGNMEMLGQRLHENFAEAASDATLLILARADVQQLLLSDIRIAQKLILMLSRRIYDLEYHLSAVALKALPERIIAILMYLKSIQQPNQENFIHITHEELAHMTGANRESVTKILNDLQGQGCLALYRGRIKLLQLEAFQAQCQGIVS